MNQSLLIFVAIAALAGAVFGIAFIELIFTSRRRKADTELHWQIKDLKAAYTAEINRLVVEETDELDEMDDKLASVSTADTAAQEALVTGYQEQLAKLDKESREALARAKAKARKLELEAKESADDYLTERKKEVEADLMDLVLHVTRQVLPATLTYDVQKQLVLEALREIELKERT
jgi:flagellar biosynthesis/type III secretory pathway protein FliH